MEGQTKRERTTFFISCKLHDSKRRARDLVWNFLRKPLHAILKCHGVPQTPEAKRFEVKVWPGPCILWLLISTRAQLLLMRFSVGAASNFQNKWHPYVLTSNLVIGCVWEHGTHNSKVESRIPIKLSTHSLLTKRRYYFFFLLLCFDCNTIFIFLYWIFVFVWCASLFVGRSIWGFLWKYHHAIWIGTYNLRCERAYGFYCPSHILLGHKLCSVNGEPSDIDPECVSHDEYLAEFKSMLITQLRYAIDADLVNDPDCIKGRKKTVQVSEFQWETFAFSYYYWHTNTRQKSVVQNEILQLLFA